MLIFGIFLFYPFLKTIYLSLYKTNKMGQAKLYVGLGNYKELLQSASFINSLKVTLIFVLIVVVGGMLFGLIAAVLCNKAFPGIRVFSTSYALPMAIASSSAAMIFQIMLHPAVGIVNKLTGLDINWLNDPNTALIHQRNCLFHLQGRILQLPLRKCGSPVRYPVCDHHDHYTDHVPY